MSAHRSLCSLCDWRSDPYLSRDLAGCRATWHVYESHRSAWQAMFGNTLPRDPDPRVIKR